LHARVRDAVRRLEELLAGVDDDVVDGSTS
jgi:hypothetical protein